MVDFGCLICNPYSWPWWRESLQLRKLLFPTSLQLKGTRLITSPSRKLMLLQIDHNYTIGVIYLYIRIDCQSFILSHMVNTVPKLINNWICWNCKGCIRKSIGPIQYRFTIPSLLAQCHVAGSVPRSWLNASLLAQRLVAGSIFLNKKKGKNNAKKLSQLHALEPARCAVIIPANTYYVFVFELSHSFASSTWRSWLNFFDFFFVVFFVQKNWASSMQSS